MPMAELGEVTIHWREDGDPAGAPVIFAHALGLDLHMWEAVIALLPQGLRLIRYDLRGHGQSSVPAGPYAMGALVRDAERLMDHLALRDAVFVGLDIGGLVAQGLAVKRLDLVRAVVLSNTAVKIGTAQTWADHIAAVRQGGLAAIADATIERWFSRNGRGTPMAWSIRARLLATDPEGYSGCAAAIGGTDFITPTSGLTLPSLVLSGSADGATPPDLVRELADLIKGARHHMIRGAGHLPPVDRPAEFAAEAALFLDNIAHATPAPLAGHTHSDHTHDDHGCGPDCGHDHHHDHHWGHGHHH